MVRRAPFRWPALRREANATSGALSIAIALTAFAGLALSAAAAGLYRAARGVPLVSVGPMHERVTFIASPQPAAPRRDVAPWRVRSTVIRRRAVPAAPIDRSGRMSTAADLTATSEAPVADSIVREGARSRIAATPGVPPAGRTASLVFLRPSGYALSSALSPTQRDSVLHRMTSAVPSLARIRRPTRAEIDSFYREDALRHKLLRENGRPVPIAVGAASISFPLFSSGPSRARRMRDSVIHQGNLLRLERITERVRAKRDSSDRSDSLKTQTSQLIP